MTHVVRTLRLGLADLLADPYPAVPFTVGAGAESLEVRLRYDRAAATVDLGCEGPAGWRGWSGGARESFVIRPDAATPGYVPGVLEAGQWRVQLHLYRLPPEPIEVTVEIAVPATSAIPPEPEAVPRPDAPRASARALPAPRGLTWFAGDFHAHSTHSDGEQSLDELAGLAVRNGLDLLAVTEHNTVSHHPHLAAVGRGTASPCCPARRSRRRAATRTRSATSAGSTSASTRTAGRPRSPPAGECSA